MHPESQGNSCTGNTKHIWRQLSKFIKQAFNW